MLNLFYYFDVVMWLEFVGNICFYIIEVPKKLINLIKNTINLKNINLIGDN